MTSPAPLRTSAGSHALTARLEQLTSGVFDGSAILVDGKDAQGNARFEVSGLPRRLQLELAYGVQQCRVRPDPPLVTLPSLQSVRRGLLAAHISSLLEHDETDWPHRGRRGRSDRGALRHPFLRFVIDELDELTGNTGADVEYLRDTWRLRRFGFTGKDAGSLLHFDIPQPWLREAAKRFIRWRIGTGHSGSGMNRDITSINRLATALTLVAGAAAQPVQFNRAAIERFLLLLVEEGLTVNGRSITLSSIAAFFNAVRRHDWLPELPAAACLFAEDFPARTALPPRALPEYVMAQIESSAGLAKLTDPQSVLLVPLLLQTGLRVNDAAQLELDCLTRDAQDAPYLRYHNHKMKRDALVPITEDLAQHINRHGKLVRTRHPQTRWLFPRSFNNSDGRHPAPYGQAAHSIRKWLTALDLRDEAGRPVHVTAHQFRHTLGTRLINNDVPQEIVRRILDHTTTEMTAHYARLHDTTVRDHWERARKVTITGEPAVIPTDSPLSDAAWMKQHLSRATMALPNGYCGLPLQQTCPHANACLTCPVFITTPEFLDAHREQLAHTKLVLEGATKRGQLRLIEMNRTVAENLTTIITALEAEPTAENR